jgi:hypothetical protein
VITELPLELPPQDESSSSFVAPMLARVADDAARWGVLAIGRRLADLARSGYEIGPPARVRPATPYTFAQWHVPVRHAGARCVLSFFIHEIIEPTHANQPRKQRAAARQR